jgi:hypothetical protein
MQEYGTKSRAKEPFMGKNWLSYFWCGGIALFLSWAMSGCYWGNKEVDVPYSGPLYYETTMNSIQLCATVQGQGSPNCATELSQSLVPPYGIPLTSGVSLNFQEVSDPFVFTALDSTDATTVGANYGFYNSNDGGLAFIANANTNGAFNFSASSTFPIYVDVSGNAICSFNANVAINGNLTTSGPFDSYTANPLTGRGVFTTTVSITQSGSDCAAAEACYNDASLCTNNNQNELAVYYSSFTSLGANVLNMSPNSTQPTVGPVITSLQYTMNYQ